METAEKIFYPIAAVGAVVGLYMAFRKQPQPAAGNQVSAQQSGLPGYMPQAVNYQVTPPQLLAPTQAQLLSDPYNPTPGQAFPANPPVYMSFNFGPGVDLTKMPLTPDQQGQINGQARKMQLDNSGGCGCGSGQCGTGSVDLSCNSCGDVNKGNYPDGAGNGIMAKSGRQLVNRLAHQDPGWLPRAAYNLAGSDIAPQTLPSPFTATNPAQQGVAEPAAQSRTQPPAAPQAGIVNQPVYNASRAVVQTLADNLGWSPAQFGNQNPKVTPSLLSKLIGVALPTVNTNSYHGGPLSSQNG